MTCDPGRAAALPSSRKAAVMPSILKMLCMAAQLRRAKPAWMGRPSGSALEQPRQVLVVLQAPTASSMSKINIGTVRMHTAARARSHLPRTLPASISHFHSLVWPGEPKLPAGAAETLRKRAESFLPYPNGKFSPTGGRRLLEVITDEGLVVATDAVAAMAAAQKPPPAGNVLLRLLAWVVADARGATVAMENKLALTVGKRLDRQAQKVRIAIAAAVATAEAERVAAAGDADLLASINAAERLALDAPCKEVYVGFHELNMLLQPSPLTSPSPSRESPSPSPSPWRSMEIKVDLKLDTWTLEDALPPHPAAVVGGPPIPCMLGHLLGEHGCAALKKACAKDKLTLPEMITQKIPSLVCSLIGELRAQKEQAEEAKLSEEKAWDAWDEMSDEKDTLLRKIRLLEAELRSANAGKRALHEVVLDMYATREAKGV